MAKNNSHKNVISKDEKALFIKQYKDALVESRRVAESLYHRTSTRYHGLSSLIKLISEFETKTFKEFVKHPKPSLFLAWYNQYFLGYDFWLDAEKILGKPIDTATDPFDTNI